MKYWHMLQHESKKHKIFCLVKAASDKYHTSCDLICMKCPE